MIQNKQNYYNILPNELKWSVSKQSKIFLVIFSSRVPELPPFCEIRKSYHSRICENCGAVTAARGRRRRETRTSRCLTLNPWVISYRISAKSRYDQHKPSSIVSPRPHIVVAIIMSTEALAGEVACQQFQFVAITAVIAVLDKHLHDVRDQNSSFSTLRRPVVFVDHRRGRNIFRARQQFPMYRDHHYVRTIHGRDFMKNYQE